MEEDLIFKKATLALGGEIRLPEGFEIPVRVSHSSSGPGAGGDSVAFSFHGMRVKKSVSREKGEFELHEREDGGLYLTHHGEPFLDEIEFDPVVYHCPEQAFFTLDSRCSFGCAFCASPRLPERDYKGLTDEDIARKSLEAYGKMRVVAVSLTSGVMCDDVDLTADRFISCIKAVRKALPDIRIGIEPYANSENQIKAFKEAGADEIKLNIQAATPEIFARVCPDLDREAILRCLGHAVEYFGRGHVTSNIIFGMGETREELERCMCQLCEMGVIPTVRSLRLNEYNGESLRKAIGEPAPVTAEEMVEVARMHKEVLSRYGMDTRTSKTMCLECGCCDLVPFRDL